MDPIILSMLFMAGVKISSTLIQRSAQAKENEKNRNEMRSLAGIQRQDTLKENTRQNALNERSMGLANKKLSFSNTMTNEYIKDKNLAKKTMLGTATQNQIGEVADSLGLTPEDKSFRSRILGRV